MAETDVVYAAPDEPVPTPLAAQHFQLIIIDTSKVSLLLTPSNTDWWEHYKRGWSDPYGGIPIYMMGPAGSQVPIPFGFTVEQVEAETV